MVVKRRVSSSIFDDKEDERLILPHLSDKSEIEHDKPCKLQLRPQNEKLDDAERSQGATPLWGTWAKKKLENSVLPVFAPCNPESNDIPAQISVKKSYIFTARKRKADAFTFIAFGLVIYGIVAYYASNNSLHGILKEIQRLYVSRKTLNIQLWAAEKDVRIMEREVSALETIHVRHLAQQTALQAREAATAFDEYTAVLGKLEDLKQKVQSGLERAGILRRRVQTLSLTETLARFGPGPHLVEVEVDFPQGPSSFTVELASLDLMPHSVQTFLEMVTAGLWDGCSFVMNARHVVKAAPLPYDGSAAVDKVEAFAKKGLDRLSFKEYNPEFPHKRYTLGFAGGGTPNWYINTEDNTDIHGAGKDGQSGDPCFGKIVDGIDTVHRLAASPTRDGIWLEQRIGIKRARLL